MSRARQMIRQAFQVTTTRLLISVRAAAKRNKVPFLGAFYSKHKTDSALAVKDCGCLAQRLSGQRSFYSSSLSDAYYSVCHYDEARQRVLVEEITNELARRRLKAAKA